MEPVDSPFPARVGEHPPSREVVRISARVCMAPPRMTGDPRLPRKSTFVSARAQILALPSVPAEHSPQLPALNGRSVRNLRPVRAVKAVRAGVAAAAASFAVVIAVGFAVPAYAAATAPPAAQRIVLQSLVVPNVVPAIAAGRDAYGVTVPPPLQWPVNPSSPISDGFGPRVAPCAGCSSNHEGVDFDAGNGAAVRAIAAGVVVETNNPGWAALGIHVAIQHVIDGKVVTSAYGHLQVGSMPVRVGDTVHAGQLIGRVGSTGASTGPHLHFEIRVGGTTPVDPVAWMHAHLG
jgi:murein DD-endopeptidase MepM/ murein hydrolase activator NlpD